jgi:hypothetical protein
MAFLLSDQCLGKPIYRSGQLFSEIFATIKGDRMGKHNPSASKDDALDSDSLWDGLFS